MHFLFWQSLRGREKSFSFVGIRSRRYFVMERIIGDYNQGVCRPCNVDFLKEARIVQDLVDDVRIYCDPYHSTTSATVNFSAFASRCACKRGCPWGCITVSVSV